MLSPLRARAGARAPSLALNLYSNSAVEHPEPHYAAIRAAGPLVWLSRHRMWAMGRYEDVRAALKDDELLISRKGVAANPGTNLLGRGTTLFSDGAMHATRRRVLMESLGARSLAPLHERLQAEAETIVEGLVGGHEFDAVEDFASGLPVRVIADLVGVQVGTDELLRWGRGAFDVLGPLNRKTLDASPSAFTLWLYSRRLKATQVTPGSWAASVFEAARRGEISTAAAKSMVIDFVSPSLDTTILAAAQMLWQLGRTPGAWERIRADPGLVAAAVVESVRLASPVRAFTRAVARDAEIAGTRVRKGERVVLLYAAANMDETQFPEPARFDLDRPAGGHLGWGNGPHTCVGIHLAKLEMQALLRAMIPRVRAIELGEPEPLRNNTLQGIARLPARFV